MNYIACTFYFHESEVNPWREILTASLCELPFESFEEEYNNLIAYIPQKNYDKKEVETLLHNFPYKGIAFKANLIESQNWNETWEKSYSPIVVENKCVIKAPFHQLDKQYPVEILINPQMSFGTGHHQTTYLMIKNTLNLDFTKKNVLDMGCGTGVLAILSEIKGSKNITAIDIDNWAYQNTLENITLNHCKHITTHLGGAELLPSSPTYEVIFANINRNILLQDFKAYTTCLQPGGQLFISGFYTTDIPILEQKANELGLTKTQVDEKESWAMCVFEK